MPNTEKIKRSLPTKYGVRSLDLLGEKFCLTYNTLNGNFQTTFGGYLTILLGLTSALVSLVVFSQLFNTRAPVVTTSLEFGSKFAKYNLVEEDLIFPLSFSYKGQILSNISKYFTLQVGTSTFRQNKTTGQIERGSSHVFDFIPCDQIKNEKLKTHIKKLSSGESSMSKSFCPDLRGLEDEYYVQYDEVNIDHRSIKLFIYPCSLPDPSECVSKDVINKIQITHPYLEKFFVSSDKKNPLRELQKQNYARTSFINTKYLEFEMVQNRLVDDTSEFSSPKITKEFTSSEVVLSDSTPRGEHLHCLASDIRGPRSFLCEPYIRFRFAASGKSLIMSRNYKGIITVMGEFGGVIKILTGLVFFLYSFYSARKMRSYFSSSIFKLNEKQLNKLEEILMRDEEDFNLGEKKSQKNEDPKPTEKKEKERKKAEMKKMMEECVESKFNAADMMYKMSLLEVLEDALFEEHDKTLLPLVMMKRFKDKKSTEEIHQKGSKANSTRYLFRRTEPQKNYEKNEKIEKNHQEVKEDDSIPSSSRKLANSLGGKQAANKELNDFERAYEELKNFSPKTEIKKLINSYIKKQVRCYFQKENHEPKNDPEEDFDEENGFMIDSPQNKKFKNHENNQVKFLKHLKKQDQLRADSRGFDHSKQRGRPPNHQEGPPYTKPLNSYTAQRER